MRALTIALCSLAMVAPLAVPAAASAESCPNAVFRNGPSSRLPDCRAYEMVSPPYKQGYPLIAEAISEDGSGVVAQSLGTFAGGENSLFLLGGYVNGQVGNLGGYYAFTRGQAGWTAVGISPPASQYPYYVLPHEESKFSVRSLGTIITQPNTSYGLRAEVNGLSSELAESLWVAPTAAETNAANAERSIAAEASVAAGIFYVRKSNGPLNEVGPALPPSAIRADVIDELATGGGNGPFFFFAFDGFREASAGAPSATFFSMRKGRWPGDSSQPGAESLYEYLGAGNSAPLLVGVSGGAGSTSLLSPCGTVFNGASQTGTNVLFTAVPCGSKPPVEGESAAGALDMRVDNGQPDAHTVAVSEPSVEDCSQCDTSEGVRQPAVAMGFSSDGSKVFFMTSQPLLGGDTSNNLYEYDADGEAGNRIVRVSGGDSTVSNPTADVESVLGASPDGSHVYFVASGVLTKTPNGLGQEAQAGQENLYVYERDAQYPNGRTEFVLPWGDVSSLGGMSQNGSFLTFQSSVQLTPDDLSSVAQGFEYDAETGAISRFSVGQDGYNDDGNSSSIAFGSYDVFVANDGSVFFESISPLVPQAVSGASNVYEYRQGDVNLISDGQDRIGAELDGISPSGRDVFFNTYDRLVPADVDEQVDVYDARVDGGFPEPPPPPRCSGDACQGSLSGAPVLLSPGSEFQAGGENSTVAGEKPTTVQKSKAKAKSRAKRKRKTGKKKRKAAKSSRGERSAGGFGGRS